MRVAVVGHVEWVEFVEVDHVPAPGQIAHGSELWAEPAGGGAVVAAQLLKLAGACDFFTALGEDDARSPVARAARGARPHGARAVVRATRRALTHVDRDRERTITTVGPKLRPRGPLPLAGYDAVFFVAGDVAALRSARAARVPGGDAARARDAARGRRPARPARRERHRPRRALRRQPRRRSLLRHGGRAGGVAGRRYEPAPPPAPLEDTYGAGDSFAAALCFALARGDALPDALALAARAGAAVITGRGPYSAQITL